MNAELELTENPQSPSIQVMNATAPSLTARITVDLRGLALGILAIVAAAFALEWAQSFFIPLLLGILLAYTLNPLVAWL